MCVKWSVSQTLGILLASSSWELEDLNWFLGKCNLGSLEFA